MAETAETVQPKLPKSSAKQFSKDAVEKLLRGKSERVVITTVEDKKKRSECWKFFGFPKVDGVIYQNMAACHKCYAVYKYS
jgi:hypothetical protein